MNAKLINARAEIQAILEKHDIAGHVILHCAPGDLEVFMHLTPGYSKLVRQGTEQTGLSFRLRSRLADYGGDAAAQGRDLAATANMVHGLGTALAQDAISMLELATVVNKATGAVHGPIVRTEGRPQ